MLGKLSWSAIPFDQPIPLFTGAAVMVIVLGILLWVIAKGWFPYLWNEWITSVDHKHIGIMYVLLGLVMLVRGFIDAIMMRAQQALAFHAQGYLPPEHYDQIFSAHGTIMVLFAAMPLVIGIMNFVVPLQLGVRDVAFPTLNSVSFWLTATGALLVNLSLVVGEFARTGWLPYPPLSELRYSPGVGVDYYLWAVQISGIGTLLTGINFVTTILKIRAPGMTYLRMPMFCWTALASCLLILAAFPVLTASLAMLTLDRYLGFHFFTNEAGGNAMMFMNLIWAWGHPEVYILVLPAFGIYSEVISTFSGKPLFGYRGYALHLHRFVLHMVAPFLHDGCRRRRKCGIRNYHEHHRRRYGRQNVQLALYHVRRAHPLHHADAMVARIHDHLHHRRCDGRVARRTASRFRTAQQHVSCRAFSPRDRGGRRLCTACRTRLLVAKGIRISAA
jgi:cytochrome o ubiquinol oxidase subunit 1